MFTIWWFVSFQEVLHLIQGADSSNLGSGTRCRQGLCAGPKSPRKKLYFPIWRYLNCFLEIGWKFWQKICLLWKTCLTRLSTRVRNHRRFFPLVFHVKAATWHRCQHTYKTSIAGKNSTPHPHVGFGHVPKIIHAPTLGMLENLP